MKKKNIGKRIITAALCGAVMLGSARMNVSAQEFAVNGDIVSSYVWRGAYCGGVSLQPSLAFSAGGFALTAWGSVGVTSPAYLDEVDLAASYSFGKFSLTVTDYWFVDRLTEDGTSDYFNFKERETAHLFEASAALDLGAVAFSWNTFFAGNDFNTKDKRAYATYVEAGVPFSVKDVGMKVELGVTPWESALYADGFNVVNIGITGSKEIRITDSFTVPAFTKFVVNPAVKQAHLVFGISL
jgi:hypothetical protein